MCLHGHWHRHRAVGGRRPRCCRLAARPLPLCSSDGCGCCSRCVWHLLFCQSYLHPVGNHRSVCATSGVRCSLWRHWASWCDTLPVIHARALTVAGRLLHALQGDVPLPCAAKHVSTFLLRATTRPCGTAALLTPREPSQSRPPWRRQCAISGAPAPTLATPAPTGTSCLRVDFIWRSPERVRYLGSAHDTCDHVCCHSNGPSRGCAVRPEPVSSGSPK